MKSIKLSINKYALLALSIALSVLYFILYAAPVSAQQGVVTPDNTTLISPSLSVVQNNQNLEVIANDNNLNPDSWQRSGPFSSEPDCGEDGTVYNQASSGNRFLVLSENDNNLWYCFKVADYDYNIGYAKFQILGVKIMEEIAEDPVETMNEDPMEPLMIEATQSGSSIIATPNRDLEGDIKWEVLIVDNAVDCHVGIFRSQSRRVLSGNRVGDLSWRDNGRHYCFRVSENEGSYVYASIEVFGLPVPPGVKQDADDDDNQTGGQEEQGNEDGADDDQDSDDSSSDDKDDEDEDDEDEDDEDTAGDEDGKDEGGLRIVGIVVVVVGILAIIAVFVFSKRQPDQNEDDDGEDF